MQSLLTFRSLLLTVAACVLSGGVAADAADSPVDAESLFAHRIRPLLKEKCLACHGENPDEIQGGLDLRSRAGMLKGGESGESSVLPGRPAESPLFLAVARESDLWSAMPPKENDRLSPQQIEELKTWIAGGAPWPSEDRIAELLKTTRDQWAIENGVTVATSGGLSEQWTNRYYDPKNLWAYEPLWKTAGTRMLDEGGSVDEFIDRRLDELGLDPAPLADRRTLIRRATFDLIGLPPTPQEIERFVNDPDPDDQAFAKVVDRLLASPHYGEQWGRHWLDVVRYADSSGYANDYERGNAWRYRDYVVRAFNEDKPYDEFIIEQLAGDELVDSSLSPSVPPSLAESEALIAVGFLRMGPWELTGMEVPRIARQRFLDDVTDAVGQVFLAHMLQCCRCHDHKFDPIPTRDYYSMQAVFATTQFAERRTPFLEVENTHGFDERKYLLQRKEFYEAALQELDAKRSLDAARRWYTENGLDPAAFEAAVAELTRQATGNTGKEVDVQEVRRLMARRDVHPDLIPPRHVGFEPKDFGLERIARKGIERLKWRLERYEPYAFSVYNGATPVMKSVNAPLRMPERPMAKGELEQTCILVGGDPFSPRDPVEPAVLSVVEKWPGSEGDGGNVSTDAGIITEEPFGRRLHLAKWIASPNNPLTARVMVNRIWQWHFGQAIAGNPNNFGATGKKPTHPELLDWLARRFIRDGWSVKSMHRLIMLSAAYRRSSTHPHPETLEKLDPLGTSYAAFRPRRLDAEELRDAMLSVSGELNRAVGGIPVRPEMNLEAALQPRMVMGTFAEAWQPSPLPSQRHRRSLYALRIRGQRDPFMEVFNAPSSDRPCEARETSTVTPQVFALFNSEISYQRALAWANRLVERQQANRARGQKGEQGTQKAEGDAPVETSQSLDARVYQHLSEVEKGAVIRHAFELAFGRAAEEEEIVACVEHWDRMTARHKQLKLPRREYPKEVVREAVEENTGEKFTFTELLEFYADFVPDLQAADVNAEVRGLAEVCLVLMNSNEFAYIY